MELGTTPRALFTTKELQDLLRTPILDKMVIDGIITLNDVANLDKAVVLLRQTPDGFIATLDTPWPVATPTEA